MVASRSVRECDEGGVRTDRGRLRPAMQYLCSNLSKASSYSLLVRTAQAVQTQPREGFPAKECRSVDKDEQATRPPQGVGEAIQRWGGKMQAAITKGVDWRYEETHWGGAAVQPVPFLSGPIYSSYCCCSAAVSGWLGGHEGPSVARLVRFLEPVLLGATSLSIACTHPSAWEGRSPHTSTASGQSQASARLVHLVGMGFPPTQARKPFSIPSPPKMSSPATARAAKTVIVALDLRD